MQQLFQLPAPPPAPENQVAMPAEQWGADLRSLLRLCNASTAAYLQDIWLTVAPLKQDMARSKMEASYSRTADSLRFRPPRIPHTAAVMVMALAFHTKDPDGVVDALKIFFLPDPPPLEGRKRPSSRGSGTRSWAEGP